MTFYTAQTRHTSPEARDRQIKLMTAALFEAVSQGDDAMFDLSIQKGANTQGHNASGYTLFHTAFRRAANDRDTKWVDKVLPYTANLFIEDSHGRSVFDASLRNYFNPNAAESVDRYIPQLHRHLMRQMPDLGVATVPVATEAPRPKKIDI